MRILSAFALVFLFSVNMLFAQSEASKPIVSRPVYFDVSPPLRDMVKMNTDKVDMTWKDGVVKNNFNPKNRKQQPDDPTFVDPIAQTFFGNTDSDTTIVSFDGVGANSGVVPPDTDGDVGPDHYFAVVNLKYAIYSKTGALLFGPVNNSSVWSGMPNNSNDGDAIVLYDEQADRWLFTQFSLPNYPNGPFYMMIAVSQTPDPTGSWYRYQYSFTDMPDYPKFGVWPDGYYMSCNRFASGSGQYVGTGAVAFNRDAMLAGNATAANILFTLPSSNEAWRMLPADCNSDFPPVGTPEYFAYLNDGPDKIAIYKFTTDWGTPANSTFAAGENIGVTSFNGNIPNGIPQKGTSVKLAAMSGSLMNTLPFYKFNDHWSMAACGTVNVGSGQAGIRWFELRKAVVTDPWSKYQEGTYAPDANSRWMGSIAIDSSNNIALGYSISSADMYPSVRYTGRLAGDPLNLMTIDESGIVNGGGSQTNTWSGTPSRWGDYSMMSLDPSSPNTFWYTQEYYATTSQSNWKTRIGSFTFANLLNVSTTATPATICLGDSSQLNAEAAGGSGTFTYAWTSSPAGFTSTLQNPWVYPAVTTRYYVDVNDGVTTITDSVDVTVNQVPVVSAGNDTIVCGWTANFPVAGSGSFLGLLQWTTSGDGTFTNPTLLSTTYTPSYNDKISGSVTLTLTAEALAPCTGLSSDAMQVVFDPCTGIADPETMKLGMEISPNPTSGVFVLTLNNGNKGPVTLTVTDVTGKTILERTITTDKKVLKETVDLGKQPNGIYLVKLKSDHETATKKVVVN
jgi:hypothetical protein